MLHRMFWWVAPMLFAMANGDLHETIAARFLPTWFRRRIHF